MFNFFKYIKLNCELSFSPFNYNFKYQNFEILMKQK